MNFRIITLHPSQWIFLILLLVGALLPDNIAQLISQLTEHLIALFGWFFMLATALFVVMAGILACGKYGAITLGQEGEQPHYSTASWLAMLFAAGMGTGLVFYGAAEPLLHYMQPPPASAPLLSDAANARRALALTYFHWGIHAWSIYALAALVIAYFSFRRQRPMLPHAPITAHHGLALGIDSIAIISVVFGLVATLSQGVLQLSDGLRQSFGWIRQLDTEWLRLGIIALLACAYTFSASTSLSKGIKYLSNLNMVLAVLLLCFVLFAAETVFLLEGFVTAIGDYLDGFVRQSFNMRQYSDDEGWLADWTITYFMWWIAWAPFVGVFIARISRGRTIRSFILGVVLVPAGFSALWFATFGGAALYQEVVLQNGFGAVVAEPYQATFALLQTLPLAELTTSITLLLLFMFIVTSADSGTYVLGMFSSQGNMHPAVSTRLFWGVVIGLVTAGSVMTGGGTDFFRSVAVFGGIPYLLIMLWQLAHLIKALRAEADCSARNCSR